MHAPRCLLQVAWWFVATASTASLKQRLQKLEAERKKVQAKVQQAEKEAHDAAAEVPVVHSRLQAVLRDRLGAEERQQLAAQVQQLQGLFGPVGISFRDLANKEVGGRGALVALGCMLGAAACCAVMAMLLMTHVDVCVYKLVCVWARLHTAGPCANFNPPRPACLPAVQVPDALALHPTHFPHDRQQLVPHMLQPLLASGKVLGRLACLGAVERPEVNSAICGKASGFLYDFFSRDEAGCREASEATFQKVEAFHQSLDHPGNVKKYAKADEVEQGDPQQRLRMREARQLFGALLSPEQAKGFGFVGFAVNLVVLTPAQLAYRVQVDRQRWAAGLLSLWCCGPERVHSCAPRNAIACSLACITPCVEMLLCAAQPHHTCATGTAPGCHAHSAP